MGGRIVQAAVGDGKMVLDWASRSFRSLDRLIKSEERIQRQNRHGLSENERHKREQERLLIQADRIMRQNQRELSRALYSSGRVRRFMDSAELKKDSRVLLWQSKWVRRNAKWNHRAEKWQR
ncbi:MAG: hypothetical protein NWE87_06925 [Candidatus Bathyarchaeota archaeon]|nr:hypothetical protein [Candidatus Bathyarchaeota archaeon]